jgi:hypothetical protein
MCQVTVRPSDTDSALCGHTVDSEALGSNADRRNGSYAVFDLFSTPSGGVREGISTRQSLWRFQDFAGGLVKRGR